MKTLGVSMIVKNESECIEACLESIKGADEIVICDTGSEDNTVEICKRYTDKVFTDYKWNDNFAEARNHSLDKCTTDWVLIIDADETLNDSIETIKKLLNSGNMTKQVEGHEIKYMGLTMFCQTKTERVNQMRIVRNDKDISWIYPVHNVLAYKGSPHELRLKCYDTHFEITSGYSPAHLKDPNRSLRILLKHTELEPDNSDYMYYIAREYILRNMKGTDHVNDIVYWLEKSTAISFYKAWTPITAEALYCLALGYIEKLKTTKDEKYWYDAMTAAAKSVVVLPSFQAPLDFLAISMMELPGRARFIPAALSWKAIADRATNADVVFIRPRTKYFIDKEKGTLHINEK